jgi:membrane dipeptidase
MHDKENMTQHGTRRNFFSRAGSLAGAGLLASAMERTGNSSTTKGPGDFIIVEGHRDIWEQSGRTRIRDEAQHWPIANFIAQRLIEGGLSVVIMPCGGDSLEERDGQEEMFEGSMRVLDMILSDIEKAGSKASIIRTKADIPTRPNAGKVQFFLDMEGGGSLQTNAIEPEFPAERSLALLRQFFRLGMRGLQLTHNGRNQLGDGRGIDKAGSRLTPFGVAVVQEMNRLGMMVGVSHMSTNALMHTAEISKTPIVSTHQNLERFVKSRPPVEVTDEEAKAVAKTGGIVGIRYIVNVTPYKLLADEVEYLAKLIGVEHIGVGWLGHDKVNPSGREVEGRTTRTYSGVEAQTMHEHWDTFIKMLSERGFTDDQINLILGANYVRIWQQILPDGPKSVS